MYVAYNMPKLKYSESKVQAFIRDELKGMKEYRHFGFGSQSKDEKRHAKHFKKLYKKMLKKKKKRK
jgi:hypothetical protein